MVRADLVNEGFTLENTIVSVVGLTVTPCSSAILSKLSKARMESVALKDTWCSTWTSPEAASQKIVLPQYLSFSCSRPAV